jgi:hypothetical protein
MPGSPDEPTAAPKGGQRLSEFIAKVLDQLSVSVWLPAVFLVSMSWFILSLRANDANLSQALESMSAAQWPEFLVLLVAAVTATVVEAFSFDAGRLLQGDWGDSRFGTIIGNSRCKRHRRKRHRLHQNLVEERARAFAVARERMFADGATGEFVLAEEEHARAYHWFEFADPDVIRRMSTLQASLENYPVADHRIMPTRLGNVTRAYEERAFGSPGYRFKSDENESGDFDHLPSHLRVELDRQRRWLDVYCTLVFVSAVVGTLALVALLPYGWLGAAGLGLGLAGSWLFYRAAIASAGTYGSALIAMKAYLER